MYLLLEQWRNRAPLAEWQLGPTTTIADVARSTQAIPIRQDKCTASHTELALS